jgi:ribonuclease PH
LIRSDRRKVDELRRVRIVPDYIKHAEGSCLIELGDTKVICTVSVEDRLPGFLKGTGTGWLTAEYSMIPRATVQRTPRESARGRLAGRTQEIQRFIGRALRSAVDLAVIGEITLWVDCDVVQADGGTRTASVTGAFVALHRALTAMGMAEAIRRFVAGVSVGVIGGECVLDLTYEEDSTAEVDMNVVMDDAGEFVEIQGAGEGFSFSRRLLDELLDLAERGIALLIEEQRRALGV